MQPVHEYEFTNGYPVLNQIPDIYDELDYQRAVRSYLWAIPYVAVYSFIEGLKRDYGAVMYLDIEAGITHTHQANFTASGMVVKKAGAGSQYVASYQDSKGNWLDGNHLYKLHLPAAIPAKNFWSLMVYDSETRSIG